MKSNLLAKNVWNKVFEHLVFRTFTVSFLQHHSTGTDKGMYVGEGGSCGVVQLGNYSEDSFCYFYIKR